MADEHTTLGRTATGTGTIEAEQDANRDPITAETGAHPVGTGVGAAGGGTIGAVVGGAVGGPVGAMIGAAIGGVAGGLAGKGVAESVNPTEEDAYWRDSYGNRPYAQGHSYDDLRPAYQYGWEARSRSTHGHWNNAENELAQGWDKAKGSSKLAWNDAKHATRDAWDRIDQRLDDLGTAPTSASNVNTGGTVNRF